MSIDHWRPAYIGVGSNLDSPLSQVESGIRALQELPESIVVLESALYQSEPLGPDNQPNYINGVIALLTKLSPQDLLIELQAIENAHGRSRTTERWGPRTLDLDLLAYANVILDSENLKLPHPGIAERNFVLLPWRGIAPNYTVPGLSSVEHLAGNAPDNPHIEQIN